jgi:hypothetical protein
MASLRYPTSGTECPSKTIVLFSLSGGTFMTSIPPTSEVPQPALVGHQPPNATARF